MEYDLQTQSAADTVEAIKAIVARQLPPDSGVSEREAYLEIIEVLDKAAATRDA